MLNLIKLNLLPYREALAQKQQKQFTIMMGIFALVGVVLAIIIFAFLEIKINSSTSRVEILKDSMSNLDVKISKINKLKQQRDAFLEKKNQIENLNHQRFQAARILDTLNTLVPDGLYLTSITHQDDKKVYVVNGNALSDGKIAIFMRQIPTTGLFNTPELINIKSEGDTQQFSIQFQLAQDATTSVDENDDSNHEDTADQSNDSSDDDDSSASSSEPR